MYVSTRNEWQIDAAFVATLEPRPAECEIRLVFRRRVANGFLMARIRTTGGLRWCTGGRGLFFTVTQVYIGRRFE